MATDKVTYETSTIFSTFTNDLRSRLAELEKNVKELDQLFSLSVNDQVCPGCNQHSLQIVEKHLAQNTKDETGFEICCSKCGFSDLIK